jgi:hypothetical protein
VLKSQTLNSTAGVIDFGSVFLNREEAMSLLKELNLSCDGLGEHGVMLMPPNADDVLSHGYQLHIRGSIDNEMLVCIRPLLEKYKLTMVNEPEKRLLVIYRPMKKLNTLFQT